jgi:hypothetical protein
MDIASHGLWGGIMFGKRNRRSFWTSFSFGILPDLLVFGPIFVWRAVSALTGGEGFGFGPPERSSIPDYVHTGYDVTHSLVIFAAVFGIVWLARRTPLWEMLAWPAHIALDLPTHSAEFFPTPFLWPISDIELDGIQWSNPWIFFPNVALLAGLYTWHYVIRPRRMRRAAAEQGRAAKDTLDTPGRGADTEE